MHCRSGARRASSGPWVCFKNKNPEPNLFIHKIAMIFVIMFVHVFCVVECCCEEFRSQQQGVGEVFSELVEVYEQSRVKGLVPKMSD